MWLIPYESTSSIVWSACSWLTSPRAAAPNRTRVLSWPVRPKGRVGIAAGVMPPFCARFRSCSSGRSMIARSVASAICTSAASFGSTVRVNQRAEATLPS